VSFRWTDDVEACRCRVGGGIQSLCEYVDFGLKSGGLKSPPATPRSTQRPPAQHDARSVGSRVTNTRFVYRMGRCQSHSVPPRCGHPAAVPPATFPQPRSFSGLSCCRLAVRCRERARPSGVPPLQSQQQDEEAECGQVGLRRGLEQSPEWGTSALWAACVAEVDRWVAEWG